MKDADFHDDEMTPTRTYWRYPKEHIDRLLDLADTVGIIGQHVNLKQSGHGRWMGVCPFHNDHDPSLSVNERGFCCFGCQAKGSVIKFLMIHEGLTFVETVKLLEQLTGVTPPSPQDRVLGCWTINPEVETADHDSVENAMWEIANKCRLVLLYRTVDEETGEVRYGWEIPIVYDRIMTIFRVADDALERGDETTIDDVLRRINTGMLKWERITNEQGREDSRIGQPA